MTLSDFKFNALAFFQVAVAFAADCGKVDKNVIAALSLNESIAFGSIEPLDSSSYSFRHFTPFRYFVRKKVELVIA